MGAPEMVGPAEAPAVASTRIMNGAKVPVFTPSLAVMVMGALSPTSPVAGVPESVPVVVSKVAHDGMPAIEKTTALPPEDTLGLKEYLAPTVALPGGAPLRTIAVPIVPVPTALAVEVPTGVEVLPLLLLPPEQPQTLAATSNPRMKR